MSHRSPLLFLIWMTCSGLAPGIASALVNEFNVEIAEVDITETGLSGDASDQSVAVNSNFAIAQAQPSPTSELSDVLNLGSRGEQVTELQEMLKSLGYYDGATDGIYGDTTKFAVIEFQEAAGLRVDGQVGETTWEELREAQAEQANGSAGEPEAEGETAPEMASETAPEVAPESAAVGNESTDLADELAEVEEAEQTSGLRIGPLVGWMIAALGLIGVIAAVAYRLKGQKSIRKLNGERSLQSRYGSVASSATPVTAADLEGDRAETESAQSNGSNGTVAEVVSDPWGNRKSDSSLSAEALPIEETTRLQKVNIVDELIQDLHNPNPDQRRKAIWDLGQRGNSDAIQPLVDLMMDSDSKQRSLILAAVSEISTRTLKPMNRALLISLQDESSEVRKNAIRDLTRIYDQVVQVSQLLRHAVEDSDEEVQETARWALGQLNRIRSLPEFQDMAALKNSANQPEQLSGDSSESGSNSESV